LATTPGREGDCTVPNERVEDRLKAMIVDRLMLKAKPDELGDEDDLIKKWNVESVQLLEIVIGLEEVFGIQLGDDEFSIKKFRTVKNIAEVVKEKKPGA
jgi:acyl carrier protein